MDFIVYLAGPISGLSFDGAIGWREWATEELAKISDGRIHGASPMRHKHYLSGETAIGDHYPDRVLSSQRGITARDRFDTRRSDAVLVNMIGATKVSIGTVMEIAWANAFQVPVILAMEDDGNVHDHAMLREVCPFRVNTLEEAIHITRSILLPV